MGATLIGRTGEVSGKDFPVADMVRIGADRNADVRIRANGVSRDHARVWREGAAYWIEDTGSTNGTFLSGARIQKDRLRHLDVVTLGRSVDLIFLVRDSAVGEAAPSRPSGVVAATLQPVDGPDVGTTFTIPLGEITLGRADSNNVVADNRAISKVHARIERTRDVVTIQDLGSANGTFVNDLRIGCPVVLGCSDLICLGGVRTFAIDIDRAGAGDSSSSGSVAHSAPVFSQEWKTRLVWSADELAELNELRVPEPTPTPEQPAARRPPRPTRNARTRPKVAEPSKGGAPLEPPGPRKVTAPPKEAHVAVGEEAAPKQEVAPPPVVEPSPKAVPSNAAAPPAPTIERPVAEQSAVSASAPMVLAPAIRLVGLTTYTLTVDRTTIGRAVAAMIRTDDKKASRVHAEIILADGEIAIEDKGSVNGTRVNGKEIRERRTLAHGDRIKIGETEWTVETS